MMKIVVAITLLFFIGSADGILSTKKKIVEQRFYQMDCEYIATYACNYSKDLILFIECAKSLLTLCDRENLKYQPKPLYNNRIDGNRCGERKVKMKRRTLCYRPDLCIDVIYQVPYVVCGNGK